MPANPANIDIGEARLIALQLRLQAGIPDLNTILNRDAQTSILTDATRYGGAVPQTDSGTIGLPGYRPSAVFLGDLQSGWDTQAEGSIKVSVSASDYKGGLDYDTARHLYSIEANCGLGHILRTSVFVYAEQWWNRDENPFRQATLTEILQQRLSFWTRYTLHKYDATIRGCDLPLRSQEFTTQQLVSDVDHITPLVDSAGQPLYDFLTNCMILQGHLGIFSRAFAGGQTFIGIHAMHVGSIGKV